jgi:hypothetical protein
LLQAEERRLRNDEYSIHKINRPSRVRRAIWFDLGCLSTSRASPNDRGIVIIVIIIVIGEVEIVIVEQSLLF